jgi:hypothetical protein
LNKKTIYIIVAVLVVVIVIAGAAAYLLNNNGNGGTTNPTPTPTPTVSVADATNLTLSANLTSQGTTTEYKWSGKDIHANMTIRVDFANYAYILDAGQEKSWGSTDSGVTWTQGNFTADWIFWGTQWSGYLNNLTHWSGSGDYSYTNTAGEAIVLSNISVNPTIPASTFATS